MIKEKKMFWEKYNPMEMWLWQNKKHLGTFLKYTTKSGPYGCRNSKWRYDFSTGEFTWNRFYQIEKHKWEKKPQQMRMSAKDLLCRGDGTNPSWISFQEAVKKMEVYNNA